MVSGWQRPAPGRGLQLLQQRIDRSRNPNQPMPVLTQMSEDDFVSLMREQGASERMINRELPAFRQLKDAQDERRLRIREAREDFKNREITEESLQSYVTAGKRRKERVASQEKESE